MRDMKNNDPHTVSILCNSIATKKSTQLIIMANRLILTDSDILDIHIFTFLPLCLWGFLVIQIEVQLPSTKVLQTFLP